MLIFKQLFTFLKVRCSIVDFTKRIRSKEVECIFPLLWIQLTHYLTIFIQSVKPAKVLTTHPTVRLDGARLANTCIPPSLLGNMLVQLHGVSTPKNTFASIQNRVIQLNNLIYKKKTEKRVQQTHFGQQWVCQTWNKTFSLVLQTQYENCTKWN